MDPPEALRQVSSTAHSVVLELLSSPVREFTLQASGLVGWINKLACCCADMPSPPPPPPLPPPPPRPPPQGPKPPPSGRVFGAHSAEADWGRGIIGHTSLAPPPSPPPAAVVGESAGSYVGEVYSVVRLGEVDLG